MSYQSSTTFSSVTSGTYTLTAKDVLSCTNSISLTINPQPTIPLAPTTQNATSCIYDLPAATVSNNGGNAFSSPVFKWYTASSGDTSSANYVQRSTANSLQTSLMTSNTYYVSLLHPTTGCESTRTAVTLTIVDPLPTYSPFTNDYIWKGGAVADINNWKTSTNWYQYDGSVYKTVLTLPGLNDNVIIPPSGTCVPAQPHVKNENTQQFKNLHIKTGGTLTIEGNGTLNLSGDWTNDGTFHCAMGLVNFVGAGNHFIKGSVPTTFYNLLLNKPLNNGTKSILKLQNQAYITGELSLTAGLFDIATFDINMDSRVINGGSSASYVKTSSTGRLQRNVSTSSVLFPIGRSAYNPATLTDNGATTDKFSIRVIDRLSNIGTLADTDPQSDSAVVERTWMIDEDVLGGNNITLRLDWNSNEHHGAFDPFQPYIAHYNSTTGKWENKGWNERNYGFGEGYVQTTGISSFSPYGISSPQNGIALPTELIYLNSSCVEQEIKIEWATNSEFNSDYFEVLFSRDGKEWDKYPKTIPSAHFSNEIQYYEIAIQRGYNYAILQQVDYDGQTTIFGPILLDCDDHSIHVYPQPFQDELTVQFALDKASALEFQMLDPIGNIIFECSETGKEGKYSYFLNLSAYPSGVYFLHLNVNNKKYVAKCIKS